MSRTALCALACWHVGCSLVGACMEKTEMEMERWNTFDLKANSGRSSGFARWRRWQGATHGECVTAICAGLHVEDAAIVRNR